MSEKELEEIREIINSMQSRLIQLFDELRELRQRLNMMSDEAPAGSAGTVVPIFSEVRDTSVVTERQSKGTDSVEPETMVPVSEHVPEMRPYPVDEDTAPSADASVKLTPLGTATVARMLDPIAHELRTGEAPAEVIAEYLQAAKDYLIGPDNPNERVARDMDVVLKFLRARGRKAIRPEERENILKRISRWKANL